jgi:hypothetical protein
LSADWAKDLAPLFLQGAGAGAQQSGSSSISISSSSSARSSSSRSGGGGGGGGGGGHSGSGNKREQEELIRFFAEIDRDIDLGKSSMNVILFRVFMFQLLLVCFLFVIE